MKKATVENGVIECVDLLFEDHGSPGCETQCSNF